MTKKSKKINYNTYKNKSLQYLESEITHTERNARKFLILEDEFNYKENTQHAYKLWQIYYEMKNKNF
jgi:hypothetical protein